MIFYPIKYLSFIPSHIMHSKRHFVGVQVKIVYKLFICLPNKLNLDKNYTRTLRYSTKSLYTSCVIRTNLLYLESLEVVTPLVAIAIAV